MVKWGQVATFLRLIVLCSLKACLSPFACAFTQLKHGCGGFLFFCEGFGGSLLWFTSLSVGGGRQQVCALCFLHCGVDKALCACMSMRCLLSAHFSDICNRNIFKCFLTAWCVVDWRWMNITAVLTAGRQQMTGTNTWMISLASKSMLFNVVGLTHDWDEEQSSDHKW